MGGVCSSTRKRARKRSIISSRTMQREQMTTAIAVYRAMHEAEGLVNGIDNATTFCPE